MEVNSTGAESVTLNHRECEVPAIANLKSPVPGSYVVHSTTTDIKFVCNDNHKPRNSEQLVRKCEGGMWNPPISAPKEIHCEPMCQVTFNLDQGSSTPAHNQWVANGADVTYSCTGHYSTTDTLTRTCNIGSWTPTISGNNLKCYQKCEVPAILKLKSPAPGSYVVHSTSIDVNFVCEDNYKERTDEQLIRKCEEGIWKPAISAPKEIHCDKMCQVTYDLAQGSSAPAHNKWVANGADVTYTCNGDYSTTDKLTRTCNLGTFAGTALDINSLKCHKNDPDVEIFFAYNHHASVDKCGEIIAGKSKNPPYTTTALKEWNYENFAMQFTIMSGIEQEYVTKAQDRTRFGVYSNGQEDCDISMLMPLAQTPKTVQQWETLSGNAAWTCESADFTTVLTCVYAHGFKGLVRANKNMYLVYFSASTEQTKSHITTMVGQIMAGGTADQKAAFTKIFTFVIETRKQTDSEYTTSKNFFESFLAPENKPMTGIFIGSVHDGASTLLTEMRKHLA